MGDGKNKGIDMSDDLSAPLSGIELSVALILGSLMGPHNHGTEACQEG